MTNHKKAVGGWRDTLYGVSRQFYSYSLRELERRIEYRCEAKPNNITFAQQKYHTDEVSISLSLTLGRFFVIIIVRHRKGGRNMLLLNYDLYDIYSVLTMLRAKPEKAYNIEIIKSVLDVLSSPQTDNIIENNIIRKKLRTIEMIDKENFYRVYVDNVYTYGWKIVKEEKCYVILTKGFHLLLECASAGDHKRLEDLADALHNIPIFFADGCKKFKKEVKVQFLHYNKTYATDLFKVLSK